MTIAVCTVCGNPTQYFVDPPLEDNLPPGYPVCPRCGGAWHVATSAEANIIRELLRQKNALAKNIFDQIGEMRQHAAAMKKEGLAVQELYDEMYSEGERLIDEGTYLEEKLARLSKLVEELANH